MTNLPQSWESRLANIIGRYRLGSERANFRNRYKEALSAAGDQVTEEQTALLLRGRDFLESWIADDPPREEEALAQWEELFTNGQDIIPASILEALFKRFPDIDPGTVDWKPFLLITSHPWLPRSLLARRFLLTADLQKIAKTNPAEFYQSAALDAIIDLGMRCPKTIWKQYSGDPRPAGMLSAEKVLVSCFEHQRTLKASLHFLNLVVNSDTRNRVLSVLLRHKEPALRFARYLALEWPSRKGDQDDLSAEDVAGVVHEWIAICADSVTNYDEVATTASLILSLLYLSSSGLEPRLLDMLEVSGVDQIRDVMQGTVVQTMKRVEQQPSNDLDLILTVEAVSLYQTIQAYLGSLPVGSKGEMDSPERALRHERFRAKKEVLQEILVAMRKDDDNAPSLRDSLEIVMFNSGVRLLGTEGEKVSFDVRLHAGDTSTILPGDPVTILEPGRYLGEGDDVLVLLKAKVTLNRESTTS